MRHFYIISNTRKDPDLRKAREIAAWLCDRGAVCSIQGIDREGASEAECVLVLGGDGTLLHAARNLADTPKQLFGINLGTLGYLAEVEYARAYEALDLLLKDRFFVEERMMLQGEAWHKGKLLLQDIALNDIVISRRSKLHVIDFRVYVDQALLGSFTADGIIISTPTGSTGYNLSAGGPIVAPQASLMLLTAVAPHTLSARPIVLPDNVSVSIEAGPGHDIDAEGAQACFDGDTTIFLSPGDRVEIRKSSQRTKLIKIRNTSFLENLREKMK